MPETISIDSITLPIIDPRAPVVKKDEETNDLEKAFKAIGNLPDLIKDGFDKLLTFQENKQHSKERIEIIKLGNEKHESNLKAYLLGGVFVLSCACYITKGIDQTMSSIICFILGFIVNGFKNVSIGGGKQPQSGSD